MYVGVIWVVMRVKKEKGVPAHLIGRHTDS